MTVFFLIKHHWKEVSCSPVWQKNLILNIIMGFVILYFVVLFLLLGFFADDILEEAFPGNSPVDTFNGLLLYYIGLEILIRFFMQAMPVLNIIPYLHLPVRHNTLINYSLVRSIVNPVNYISFLIFIPFSLKVLSSTYPGASVCCWLLSLLMLITFCNYFALYIKRQLIVKPWVTLLCGLVYVGVITADYFKVFSLLSISQSIFNTILFNPVLVIIPMILAVGMYYVNFLFLKKNIYPEEFNRNTMHKSEKLMSFRFTDRLGSVGHLLSLELKLLFRNKRTKSLLYLSLLFSLYGLFLYKQQNSLASLTFAGMFLTGIFPLAYGQFLIAWEGRYFDGILTRNTNMYQYFRAKFLLLASATAVNLILSLPYAYFYDSNILLANVCCFLFNVGVNSYILLYLATFNRKKIDLSSGSVTNWQGTTASQFLIILPIFILPLLLIFIVSRFTGLIWALLLALALPGLIGLILNKPILKSYMKYFTRKKYIIAAGFRES